MLPLQRKVKTFPDKPGVYIFKEKSGKVIYVGKARSLKKRASSYFKTSPDTKVSLITGRAHSIEYIITSNELEALLLESNLIKKHKPRYNVLLRDDKQYPYIKITLNEEWPRVLIVRKIEDDGAAYYGPYLGRTALDIIKMFKRLLQLVWCRKFKMRKEPCFYYHLDKCPAPCVEKISKKEYMNIVNEAIDFLEGKVAGTIDKLKKEMRSASEAQQYERAAVLRNKIRAFERVLESQEVLTAKKEDKDVASLTILESKAVFLVLQIRGGKLIGKESYFINNSKGEGEDSLLFSTIIQYYTSLPKIPPEIVVKPDFKDLSTLRKTLSRLKESSVKLVSPKSGGALKLYDMAKVNANYLLEQNLKLKSGILELMEELKNSLGLPTLPARIEAFDISTIMGKETVGSMVVFEEARPLRNDYRKFKVRIEGKPDDVHSIEEVVSRRYKGGLTHSLPLPDLILIDGGKPQINAAKKAVAMTPADNIPMIGLAKKLEQIYLPGKKDPLILSRRSPALKLLQRIRNEAHRFAITYHKLRRKKAMVR